MACLPCGAPLRAQEPVKPAKKAASEPRSATFTDILRRVSLRDKDSGAILSVRTKEDSPGRGRGDLAFRISPSRDEKSVEIELTVQSKTRVVYEAYQLAIDPAIRAELAKLELMEKQQAARAVKEQAEQTERIARLSAGKLRRGMTREEVIAAWGEPSEFISATQAGSFILKYPGFILRFRHTLSGISLQEPEHSAPAQ